MNQSTRIMPVARSVARCMSPKSCSSGVSGLARLATWLATTSASLAGEEQELLDLVRGDVGQDAAVARALEEPGRRGWLRRRCGPRPMVCITSPIAPARPARRRDGGGHLEVLGVEDREDAAGLGLDPPQLGELVQRRHARLVEHHVLAVAHRPHRHRRGRGDAGAEHEQAIASSSRIARSSATRARLREALARSARRGRPRARGRRRARRRRRAGSRSGRRCGRG